MKPSVREWEWDTGPASSRGVSTELGRGRMLWFTRDRFGGHASYQSIDKFLGEGPLIQGFPETVLEELRDFLSQNGFGSQRP